MELHLPRDEIVRQVRAHLGEQTNNALGAATNEQTVVIVQSAAVTVHADCQWVNAQARVTVTLGAQQNVLAYPEGGGPGSVFDVAVFDGGDEAPAGQGQYYRVQQRIIPVYADQDQQQAAGGSVFTDVQGRPQFYEQRDQIILWPFSKKAYQVRIGYKRQNNLPLAGSVCIVDAQLIIYKAVEMVAVQRAAMDMARYYAGLYADRLGKVKGYQAAGTQFAMDGEADLGENEFFSDDNIPRWDRSLTIRPSMTGL